MSSDKKNNRQYELDNVNENTAERGQRSEDASDGRLTKYLIFCLLVAAFGSAFQFGWSTGILNTPENVVKDFYNDVTISRTGGKNLSNDELKLLWSVTNGLQPLGGMFGGLSSGFVADFLGRKTALLSVNVFVIVGTILGVISKAILSYETIMVNRFFAGVVCGLFSGIFPMYLNECAPKNLRGRIGVINQLALVFGILVVNIIGLDVVLGTAELWPVIFGLSLVPTLIHTGLFFTVESPKYMFINKGNEEATRSILLKLRENDERLVQAEIDDLADEKQRIAQQDQVTWGDMVRRPSLRRALVVTVVLQLSQQLSGINAVIFYSTGIFESAGLSWASYATLLIGGVQLIMTLLCMLIIDKAGRKPLLLIGQIGMSLFSFALALTLIFKSSDAQWLNYLTVVCAVVYIVFFSVGPGAIPWLITSELFESDARGKATSIAVFCNWLANFIVVVSFPFVKDLVGDYTFFIFGVLLILFALFTLFFCPETKNKRTEDIVDNFDKRFIFFPS